MHFKDTVPKSYQEFKDVFTKECLNDLPDQKKWDHNIELVPDSQSFSIKVYPLAPVKQKQLDDFLGENLKIRCNMLMCSLQRRVVENQPVFERSLLPRHFLGS